MLDLRQQLQHHLQCSTMLLPSTCISVLLVLLVDLQACNSWLLLLKQFFVSSDIKLPAAHMVITAIPTPTIKGLCCIKSALLCYWLYYCCCQNCQLIVEICLHLQMTILYSPILAVPPLQLLLATLCQYWFQVHWRLLVLALLQIADAMATNWLPPFWFSSPVMPFASAQLLYHSLLHFNLLTMSMTIDAVIPMPLKATICPCVLLQFCCLLLALQPLIFL